MPISRSQEIDPTSVWKSIDDAIVRTILSKEDYMVRQTSNSYSMNKRSFFEPVRFDFVLDRKV